MARTLAYSLVIATRNREKALAISLPLMIRQSPPPDQLIIIDSSDDHELSRKTAESATNGYQGELIIQKAEPSASAQRNQGIALVRTPITILPDDDSIFFPDTALKIIDVYSNDTSERISAVCAAESKTMPDAAQTVDAPYKIKLTDRFKRTIAYRRYQLEDRLVPDPARLVGRHFIARNQHASADPNIVPVEWMTGFRMSFRTDVIRRVKFDEAFNRYSLFEDIDASFAAWKIGAVMAQKSARIFHMKSPERRSNGIRMGATQILNKAYVIAKHANDDPKYMTAMRRFATYKTIQYRLAAKDQFSRERYRAASIASKKIDALFESRSSDLSVTYASALADTLSEASK